MAEHLSAAMRFPLFAELRGERMLPQASKEWLARSCDEVTSRWGQSGSLLTAIRIRLAPGLLNVSSSSSSFAERVHLVLESLQALIHKI
jgi:hypothetical protein